MIHLGRVSLAATGIVMGGMALGAALAAFANPLPKPVEPAPWEGRLHPQIVASGAGSFYQSLPEDLYPASLPSSYAPASAFTEMRWPAEVPMPRFTDAVPALPELTAPTPSEDTWNARQLADAPVSAPHYAAMEQASQAAQDTGPSQSDADTAELTVTVDPAAPPPLPAAEGSAKTIHLASAEG